ncbi:MAG: sulfite exporter TauE/SafE family protein [Anaerolineales bacterium]|jgi:sulfite exporter TauE/SafE
MGPIAAITSLFISGLIGSLGHCLGMCGPLNLIVAVQIEKSGLPKLESTVLYHSARIAVYTGLGLIVGILGSLLSLSRPLSSLSGIISIILGLLLGLLGAGYLGFLKSLRLESKADWWNRVFSRLLERRGRLGVIGLGALNGLLPCGLVYAALLVAASSGSVWSAGAGMLAFGLGTFPALLAVNLGAGKVSARFRRTMMRTAGALMVLVGLQLILRGGAALQIWSHLHLGKFVLW